MTTLSLSGRDLGDCGVVVRAMQELGLSGDVTRNVSLVDGMLEPGCRALVTGHLENTKSLWEDLRTKGLNLQCAHVVRHDLKSGCVYDVFAESRCPGSGEN